ncbi:cyclic AMP-responsive element-binding protein 3-like protein 3-B [Osmerus eperlanus]|uniref:cyclic AMP-responsive element-binding protein 3-like protein 3-B n=1 Tax=Osmerus eperlanus TaxID=29151 RepID=UPI002E13727F
MTQNSNKMHGGMELLDLLLNQADNIQPWPVTLHGTVNPGGDADDFLDTLLGGSDSSSPPTSPLWSPCPSDSGISEDPASDHLDSPHPPASPAIHTFQLPPQSQSLSFLLSKPAPDVSIDLSWESGLFPEITGLAQCLSATHNPRLPPGYPLTVKGLLLSGLGEKAQRNSPNSLKELVLNEDEKKLLAKEGVNLPNKLPLSKFEERVLKKIRRKIRNKQSAQESRKKKREYVDRLEERMSACSTHNLELQRKVYQLEQTNTSLLEQLGRLQSVLTNGSGKPVQTGTCILVLLLSFSLLLSPSLQPDPYTSTSQEDFTETRVPSRSLQSVMDTESTFQPTMSLARGVELLVTLLDKLHFGPKHPDTNCLDHNLKHPL